MAEIFIRRSGLEYWRLERGLISKLHSRASTSDQMGIFQTASGIVDSICTSGYCGTNSAVFSIKLTEI